MSLRGGNDVDSYDVPTPFDPAADAPTDGYIETFGFWGIAHLDADSWRHYLPRLVDYALARRHIVGDLAIEAIILSLRPPDRDPPRLGSLDAEEEGVLRDFLTVMATDGDYTELAQQVISEWWGPEPLYRAPDT